MRAEVMQALRGQLRRKVMDLRGACISSHTIGEIDSANFMRAKFECTDQIEGSALLLWIRKGEHVLKDLNKVHEAYSV